jgi:hypothetical protein
MTYLLIFDTLIIFSEFICLKRYHPHVLMKFYHLNKSLVCLLSESQNMKYIYNTAKTWMYTDKSTIYFRNGKQFGGKTLV